MYLSPLVACGLFVGLLALGLEGKPAPQNLQKSPAALGRELAQLLEGSSGPAAAPPGAGRGGSKASASGQPKTKGAAAAATGSSSSSRLMRDLRTDGKPARGSWARGTHPEHHGGGGGGGGGGGSRRFKGLHKKGLAKGCFGLKLDRIGSMSGLGC